MKTLLAILLAGVSLVALQEQDHRDAKAPLPTMGESGAVTYESLAQAIIALRATEKELVRGMLTHYAGMAARYLELAAGAQGTQREQYLQSAAVQIDNIAHEGNRQVRAIRARLLEAGHRHKTGPGSPEDYIFINGTEKQVLIVLANKINKLTADTPEQEIRAALRNFLPIFEKYMAAEQVAALPAAEKTDR